MKKTNSAHIALNKKLKLERKLYLEIAAIFNDVIAKASGPFFDPHAYDYQVRAALLGHYMRVFNVFGDDYRASHNIKVNEYQTSRIAAEAKQVFSIRAERQARIIGSTSQRQLVRLKKIANDQMDGLLKINPDLTFHEHLTGLYGAALLRRVESISIFETQWSAEFSKANEVNQLTYKPIELKAAKTEIIDFKRWDAVGDDRMREWHADADSTVIPFDEPFIVHGEELMYPGDDSLGATASNLINCRCSVSYELDENSLMALEPRTVKAPVKKTTSPRLTKEAKRSRLRTLVSKLEQIDTEGMSEQDKKTLNHYFDQLADRMHKLDFQLDYKLTREEIMRLESSIHKFLFKHEKVQTLIRVDPMSYRPTSVRVSDVPEGFEIDHEKAIVRAANEIESVLEKDSTPYKIAEAIKELNASEHNIGFTTLKDELPQYLLNNTGSAVFGNRDPELTKAVASRYKELVNVMHESLYKENMKHIVTIISDEVGRASANPLANTISLPGLSPGSIRLAAAHEFGHHIEFNNPAVRRRFQDWREKRIKAALAKGDKWKESWGNGYLIDDDFFNPYISRVYPDGFTEALSMGVEGLFDHATMQRLRSDPEHFGLVWATLRGY